MVKVLLKPFMEFFAAVFLLLLATAILINTTTAQELGTTILNAAGDALGIIIHGLSAMMDHFNGTSAHAPVCPPGGHAPTPGC